MAKLPDQPDSATSEWFFNLGDNRTNLDNQNSGFTVFGGVTNQQSLAVVQQIGSLGRFDASVKLGGSGPYAESFTDLPVTNLTALQARMTADPLAAMQVADLVMVYRVSIMADVVK
jgi:cyclophilin family peptidyl-prolyl cis-trans isomerase